MKEKVMAPWTPVTVNEDGNSIKAGVWGREYASGNYSFLQSVISQNQEILAGPVRFVGTEDGIDCEWKDWMNFVMDDSDESFAEICSTSQTSRFIINTAMHIEYDGCIDTTVKIAPRGNLINVETMGPYDYRLTRLWLEIPIKTECATYFQNHVWGNDEGMEAFERAGLLTKDLSLPFREQIFLSNDNLGFFICFDSQVNFEPFDNKDCMEILKKEDHVLLRIRLFDEEPHFWKEHTQAQGINLFPITFRFGMMATPIKPMPKNIFKEKAVHIDCFKKIPDDYEEFLSKPFGDTDEITFDRLERLGVNVLYLHEKWNDMQNSPRLTTRTARRIRYIVDEAHRRGMKVVPYFGYEMSTLAPYFHEKYHETIALSTESNNRWYWNRRPPQRDIQVCQNSDWSEYFTENLEKLIDEFHFDGVYLDGTPYQRVCLNTKHGCGFRTPDGKLHYTYPVWGTRKTMKKLYEIIVEKRGGIINCHAGSVFNLPALSFATSLWDGEAFQSAFMNGKLEKLPDDYFRGLYTGRNMGIPVYMLCYLNPPVWDFNMALATCLPFGIIPKSNDAGEPLEIMSKIWKIYDRFDVEKAQFISYYSDIKPAIKCSNPNVKVSVFQFDDKLLAICASFEKAFDASFKLESEYKNVTNAMTDEKLSSDGTFEVSLKGFDYIIIEAHK